VAAIVDDAEQVQTKTDLAILMARHGRPDEAVALARGIADAEARIGALTAVARAGLGNGRGLDNALSAGLGPAQTADLMVRIAMTAVGLGTSGSAERLIVQAREMLGTVTEPDRKVGLLAALAAVTARAGDQAQALTLTGVAEAMSRISDSPPRDQAGLI